MSKTPDSNARLVGSPAPSAGNSASSSERDLWGYGPDPTTSYSSDFSVSIASTGDTFDMSTEAIYAEDLIQTPIAGRILESRGLSRAVPEIIAMTDFIPVKDTEGEDTDFMTFLLMQIQLNLTIKRLVTAALQDTMNKDDDYSEKIRKNFSLAVGNSIEILRALMDVYRVFGNIRESLNLKGNAAFLYTKQSTSSLFSYVQNQAAKKLLCSSTMGDTEGASQPASLGAFFQDTLKFSPDHFLGSSSSKLFLQLITDLENFIQFGSLDMFPDEDVWQRRRFVDDDETQAWRIISHIQDSNLEKLLNAITNINSSVKTVYWGRGVVEKQDYNEYVVVGVKTPGTMPSFGSAEEARAAGATGAGADTASESSAGGASAGGTSTSCFVAGTMVTLSTGKYIPIETVKVGDSLLGEDGNKNEVLEVYTPMLEGRSLYSINGSSSFVTSEHPFRTVSGWRSISPNVTRAKDPELAEELCLGKLDIGDVIMCLDSEEFILEISEDSSAVEQVVYNFCLSGNKTYYANGYLVHNKTSGTGRGGGSIPPIEHPPTMTVGSKAGTTIGKIGSSGSPWTVATKGSISATSTSKASSAGTSKSGITKEIEFFSADTSTGTSDFSASLMPDEMKMAEGIYGSSHIDSIIAAATISPELDDYIEALINMLPGTYAEIMKTLSHVINRDFAISNMEENQFSHLISTLSEIDSSVGEDDSTSLRLALNRALGGLNNEDHVCHNQAGSGARSSLGSIASLTNSSTPEKQVMTFEVFPVESTIPYFLGGDYYLSDFISDMDFEEFESLNDRMQFLESNVDEFLRTYLSLGSYTANRPYDSFKLFPFGSTRISPARGTYPILKVCRALQESIKDSYYHTAIRDSPVSYSPWTIYGNANGGEPTHSVILSLMAAAASHPDLMTALIKFSMAVSAVEYTVAVNSARDNSEFETSSLIDSLAEEVADIATDIFYVPGGSMGEQSLMTGRVQLDPASGTQEFANFATKDSEHPIKEALLFSVQHESCILRSLARIDPEMELDAPEDGNRGIGYTHPFFENQSSASTSTSDFFYGCTTLNNGWNCMTRQALYTIMTCLMVERYNSPMTISTNTDKKSFGDATAPGLLGFHTTWSKSKFKTFYRVIYGCKLYLNGYHADGWQDGVPMTGGDMEDEWEAEVHDFVRNRLDEADLASEEVMDSAFSEDWEVAINEMRGNVFAPLLKEMNYIRDILRFLSGHQATIKEAYSSIGDIDTLTSTSESAIDKVSTMMGEGNIGVVDSEQIRQQLFSGLYSESLASSLYHFHNHAYFHDGFLSTESASTFTGTEGIASADDNISDFDFGRLATNFGHYLFPHSEVPTPRNIQGLLTLLCQSHDSGLGVSRAGGDTNTDIFLQDNRWADLSETDSSVSTLTNSKNVRIFTVGLTLGMLTYLREMASSCSLEGAVSNVDSTIVIKIHKIDLQNDSHEFVPKEYTFDASVFINNMTSSTLRDGDSMNLMGSRANHASDISSWLKYTYADKHGILMDDTDDYEALALDDMDWSSLIQNEIRYLVCKLSRGDDNPEEWFKTYDFKTFTNVSSTSGGFLSNVLQADDSAIELTENQLKEIAVNHTISFFLKEYQKHCFGLDFSEVNFNYTPSVSASSVTPHQGAFSLSEKVYGTSPKDVYLGTPDESHVSDIREHFETWYDDIYNKLVDADIDDATLRRLLSDGLRSSLFGCVKYFNRSTLPNLFERTFCIPIDVEDFLLTDGNHPDDLIDRHDPNRAKFYTFYASVSLITETE